jgi:hypothetical protein
MPCHRTHLNNLLREGTKMDIRRIIAAAVSVAALLFFFAPSAAFAG